MDVKSFTFSARTIIILIIYCIMIPLGIFFEISIDDKWSNENSYPVYVYLFAYTYLCFPLFTIFITYWIDDAYEKSLYWFLERWWLICFLLVQLLCVSLDFYLIQFLVYETEMKTRWDSATLKYVHINKEIPVDKMDGFINHMKNFFPLEQPPIFVYISLFLMNILIFALLTVYSIKHDLRKVQNSYQSSIESNSEESAVSNTSEEIAYSSEKNTPHPHDPPLILPAYYDLNPERTDIN